MLYAVGDRQVHDFMIDQSHPSRELIEAIVVLLAGESSLRSHDIAMIAARGASIAPRQADAVIRILRRQRVLRDGRAGELVLDGEIDWDDALARRRHELARLDAMDGYARTRECRRGFILHYFGDPDAMAMCGDCDNCQAHVRASPSPPRLLRRLLGRG